MWSLLRWFNVSVRWLAPFCIGVDVTTFPLKKKTRGHVNTRNFNGIAYILLSQIQEEKSKLQFQWSVAGSD